MARKFEFDLASYAISSHVPSVEPSSTRINSQERFIDESVFWSSRNVADNTAASQCTGRTTEIVGEGRSAELMLYRREGTPIAMVTTSTRSGAAASIASFQRTLSVVAHDRQTYAVEMASAANGACSLPFAVATI